MTDLRTTERDLREAATELREEQIPDVEQQRERVVAEVQEEYGDASDAPTEYHQTYQQLTEQLRELHGTADTFDHYADQWAGEGEPCVFVLEELNGDEYAKTIDEVSAEARRQAREEGDLPQGYGRIKALSFGVIDKPADAPADPGRWPAAIVGELFDQLNQITAPSGVDVGNESLSEAVNGSNAPTVPDTTTLAEPNAR